MFKQSSSETGLVLVDNKAKNEMFIFYSASESAADIISSS